eukprot:gene22869-35051_t
MRWKKLLFPPDKPSPLFYIADSCLNVAVFGICLWGLQPVNSKADCDRPYDWLGLTCFMSFLNVAFMLHLWVMTSRAARKGLPTPPASPRGSPPVRAAYHMLLYDYGVYLYALLFVFMLVWNFIPAEGPWWAGGKEYRVEACTRANRMVAWARALTWVHQAAFLLTLLLAVCCPFCWRIDPDPSAQAAQALQEEDNLDGEFVPPPRRAVQSAVRLSSSHIASSQSASLMHPLASSSSPRPYLGDAPNDDQEMEALRTTARDEDDGILQ